MFIFLQEIPEPGAMCIGCINWDTDPPAKHPTVGARLGSWQTWQRTEPGNPTGKNPGMPQYWGLPGHRDEQKGTGIEKLVS